MTNDDSTKVGQPADDAQLMDEVGGAGEQAGAAQLEGDQEGEGTSLDLQVSVRAPSACERHVTVTIARADIERYFDDAVGNMMGEAHVPGFRQGRAPRKLVESHYRKELSEKIKGALLMDSMTQVTETEDFSAISEPEFDFDAVELPDEGPMTFEFNIEVRPEFDLPKWKGLKLESPVKTFDAKDIDDQLVKLLERHAVLEPVETPATVEDVLVVDVQFQLDGQAIGELKQAEVRLRPQLSFRDALVPDFGEVMEGVRAGETRKVTAQVSEQAEDEAIRGKQVEVQVNVLEVKRLVPPKITQAMLEKLGDFDSEGDLRDAVQRVLENQLAYHRSQHIRKQISKLLTDAANWELPPHLLRRQAQRELQRAVMELRSSGFSDDQINAHANMLRQNSLSTTEAALKEHFILERIAEAEEIEATDADFDQEIDLIARQGRESPRSIRARYEKQGLMDALRNQIVENKAISRIIEEATMKDVPFQPKQTQAFAVDFAIGADGKEDAIPQAKHGGDPRELAQPVDRS